MSSDAKSRSSSSFSDSLIVFLLISIRLSIASCSSCLLKQRTSRLGIIGNHQLLPKYHSMCQGLTLLSCVYCTAIQFWRIYQAWSERFARSQSSFGSSLTGPSLSYEEHKNIFQHKNWNGTDIFVNGKKHYLSEWEYSSSLCVQSG